MPPGAGARVLDYSGNFFNAPPNHLMAFVQTGPNEQMVWFTVCVAFRTQPVRFFNHFNRRYRADANSPWYWQYSTSPAFSDPNGLPGFITQVLYSPTPKYSQYPGGPLYKYVMFFCDQPWACNGPTAGYGMVSLSNDGICWTPEAPMRRAGGPSSTCAPQFGNNLVPLEASGAIDGGNTIYFVYMEGDNTTLIHDYNMNHNYGHWGTINPTSVVDLTIGGDTDLSDAGLFNPHAPLNDGSIPDRFRSYAYLMNLAVAWDAASGDLYLTRAYPYPYDRCNTCRDPQVPSELQDEPTVLYNNYYGADQYVADCGGQAALYPNRYQIYRMHLGALSSFPLVHTGTWTLLADRGWGAGYESRFTYTPTALVAGQTNAGRDSGAASFLVDGAGQLVRSNGIGYVFPGPTLHELLSNGRPCHTTGFERVVLTAIP
ncbi:MAG TPA: hypothetical protein VJ276_01650 [Thermoanaerobaculia bacterium]|nr:hypothetical protein [Thermoanaerobaculia bacterium]